MNVAIIQARCGSARLPNKIFLELNNEPILLKVVNRIKKSKYVDKVVVATTCNIEDNKINIFCQNNNIECYRGDERDLLNRYYFLTKLIGAKNIIRLTCDCPFIDVKELDNMIKLFNFISIDPNKKTTRATYIYNTNEVDFQSIYPEGSDIEICNMEALSFIWEKEKEMREHATGCLRLKKDKYQDDVHIQFYDFLLNDETWKHDFTNLRLSIDDLNDYNLAKFIFEHFKENENFSFKDILSFLDLDIHYKEFERLTSDNKKLQTGQKLYKKAKEIIPGGTQLLSKRPEMFLPENWPSYYSKVEGIVVTDLDGNKYLDMGINGIGSCILGASDKDINDAVIECVNRGSMSTLNHPNEVYLTQKLIDLHPWANMARYTRTSGEACSVAVRIARAYSKKDTIAFCGYHGWHDWYLSTNIKNSGLDKHLISGLSTIGVPSVLEGTIYPFSYNKIDELEKILLEQSVGCIIMEPMRSEFPKDNFLQKVRTLATQHKCVLIFDEVTSGFRMTNGGLHKYFDINPDMVVFGKAVSNGFPMGIVLGKKEIMEKAQETFISSTYWTEGIGFTAALATINKFVEINAAQNIKEKGEYFQLELKKIIEKHNMNITVGGLPCISTFTFNYEEPLAVKTLFIQEMLKKGYLSTVALYMTYAHTKSQLDDYLKEIENFIKKYKSDIESNNIEQYLEGPICHAGFKRVN